MSKVVVTGGAGFVGRHLIQELNAANSKMEVISWDRPDVDITDASTYDAQLTSLQPDWVVHLAAFSAPGDSFRQKELVWQVNVEATRMLLQTVEKRSPGTKVLAASSADIYGTALAAGKGQPVPELSLEDAQPCNPYAESKLEMEKMIVSEFNKRVMRVRPFPHIGPGQARGFVTADFAYQIAAIEAKMQPPIIKVGNLEAIRDFTDVRDVVKAYRLLMEQGSMGEVYHIASGQGARISQVLDELLKLSEQEIAIEPDVAKMRPSDVPVLVGDAGKLKRQTGWEPEIGLATSLKDVLDWWRSQF